METKQVLETYDDDYAATYNQKFLLNESSKRDADFEASLLRQFLSKGASWLDVACGTGYFLSLFPDVKRAGLDISPAMLAHARRENPGVELFQRSFLDEIPEWEGRWDVVSRKQGARGTRHSAGTGQSDGHGLAPRPPD